jgi:hypothetical protein
VRVAGHFRLVNTSIQFTSQVCLHRPFCRIAPGVGALEKLSFLCSIRNRRCECLNLRVILGGRGRIGTSDPLFYLPAPGKPAVNRMEPITMFHFPLKGFLITERNRADLDWSSGSFNWRYRNRLTAERRLHDSLLPSEALRQRRSLPRKPIRKVGCPLPLSKHIELDPYYQHENAPKSPEKRCRIDTLALLSQEQEMKCGFAEQEAWETEIRSPNFGCVVIAKGSLGSYIGRVA